MKLTSFGATHIGKRESNQDRYGQVKNADWACYFVADGLGGHTRGEIAATAVCDSLTEHAKQFADIILTDPIKGMQEYLDSAIKLAQVSVLEAHQRIDTQTTLALVWLAADQLITAHIGDSRVYLLNKETIVWRTPDHTPVQELFEKGEITESQIPHHPMQNQLLNAINMFDPPDPDIFVYPPLAKDETVILCTDGLWGECSAHDLMSIAQSNGNLSKIIDQLIISLVEHSGDDCDNITLQAIKQIG